MKEELTEIMRPYIESGEYTREELEDIFAKEQQKLIEIEKVEYTKQKEKEQKEYQEAYEKELDSMNPFKRFVVQVDNSFQKNFVIMPQEVFSSTKVTLGQIINGIDPTGGKVMDYIVSGGDPNEYASEEEIGSAFEKFRTEEYLKQRELQEKSAELYTGKGIVGGFREGDAVDVATGMVNAVFGATATYVPAYISRGYSLAPQIMAPMYTEYNAEKAKALYPDDDFKTAITKLYEDGEDDMLIPATLGAASVQLEKIGIKHITNYVMNNARKAGAKRVAHLLLTGSREGATEFLQHGLNAANTSIAQQDDMKTTAQKVGDALWSQQGAEAFFQGFVGGSTLSAAGGRLREAFRDDNDNTFINEGFEKLATLQVQKARALTPNVKSAIDKQIKEQEEALRNYIKTNARRSTYLTEQESNDLISSLDTRKNLSKELTELNKQLKRKIINQQEYDAASLQINKNLQFENERVTKIKDEANKKMLQDRLRGFEEPLSRTLGLKIQNFAAPKDFLDALNARSKTKYTEKDIEGVDGLIIGKDILINETVAARNNAVTVGSHEVLHAIVRSSLRGINKRKVTDAAGNTIETNLTLESEQMLQDFVNNLSKRERAVVQKRIDDNYRYNEDGTEKAFAQYAEEYLTAYSDAALKQEFSDSLATKFKNLFEGIFNKGDKGYKKLSFKDAKDVKEFVKGYVSDRKKGRFSEQYISMIDAGLDMEADVQTSKTKRDLKPEERKVEINKVGREFTDELKTGGDTINFESEGGNAYWQVYGKDVAEVIQERGLLDGVIGEIYKSYKTNLDKANISKKDFVDSVYTELLPHIKNYKPEMQLEIDPKKRTGLNGWVIPQMRNKALQAYNDLTKGQIKAPTVEVGQTTKEGDIKIQVADEQDPAMQRFEVMDLSPAAVAKREANENKKQKVRKSKLRKSLGIKDDSDLYNAIKNSARQSLILAYQKTRGIENKEQRAEEIANIIANEYAGEKGLTSGKYTELFKKVKDSLGVEKNYFKTLRENKDAILETIFTSDLVNLERKVPDNEKVLIEFKKKITSQEEGLKLVKLNKLTKDDLKKLQKGQSVNEYSRKDTTPDQWVGFFDQPLKIQRVNEKTGEVYEVRSGLKGTRKDGISKYIAKGLIFDSLMEVRQEPEVKKLLTNEFEAQLDIAELAAKIDRNTDLMLSKTVTRGGLELKYNSLTELTDLQYSKLPLPALEGVIQGIEKRIANNTASETDLYLYNSGILEAMKKGFEQGLSTIDIYNTVISKLPPTKESLGPDFKDIFSFVKFIKNTTMPQVRSIGLNAASKRLAGKLQLLKDKDKPPVINEFLKNIGRSTRSGMIQGLTTNRIVLERLLKPIAGEKFIDDNYGLQPVEYADGTGEIITFLEDGEMKPVPMYENIENIKNNARSNKDLVKKINREAIEARDYVMSVINDTNLNDAEKLAIIDLMSLDQRGAIRKMYTMGITLSNNSNLTSKDLVLEHEITISDMVIQLKQRVKKGEAYQDTLNEYMNAAQVHILPKKIDTLLNKAKLKFKGGLFRYTYNEEIVDYFAKLYRDGTIETLPSNLFAVHNGQNINEVHLQASKSIKKSKGISILDFDDTLATTKSLVRFTRPDGTKGTLTPEQYASTYESLLGQGYQFDFSEFSKVVDGKPAPLLEKAKKLAGKFGTKDMFILTARPADSAPAIQKFLKENGLDIPLKNITGLGNSTADAKALWVLDKAAEGYNDFYFADDAIQNVQAVQNMLNQIDVKSKVQQARVDFSKSKVNDYFNAILRDVSGVPREKIFSKAEAERAGALKGKFKFFVPPSHEDLIGLLYKFMGKGERGNRHRRFFETTLIKPLNEAYRLLNSTRQAIANDYKQLLKNNPEVKRVLGEKLPDGNFTYEDAIRVYLFNKAGYKVPGISTQQVNALVNVVYTYPELRSFADHLGRISKVKQGYIEPGDNWTTGNIKYDLVDATGRVGRDKFFTKFNENADIIFSNDNLNKIESIYGKPFREALEDILYRTKTGNNRPTGKNKQVNAWLDWINGSVGAVMFFNARSAILQQLSFVNFLNFADNNIFKAAAKFSNQEQFWKDFSMLFNSSYLKQRRSGAAFDVNANEIARDVSRSRNPVRAAIRHLLDLGFLPTQLGDSFAIAIGGASFYRNRVDTYIKQGLNQKEAESKAFLDFQTIAEETQQSARPDMISQQQASPLGRLVLAFQNVTSQYVRIMKKSYSDLVNRRISRGYTSQAQSDTANISRIIYYGAIQSLIFSALQNALFAMMFDEDEKDEEFFKTKKERVLNNVVDSILKGSGVTGAVISTLKNYTIKLVENNKSDSYFKTPAWIELLQVSPPIGIKVRKLARAEKNFDWNKDVIKKMNIFDLDNPIYDILSTGIEGITNIPINRLYKKTQNLRAGMDSDNAWWQRIAVTLGWSKWEVGIEDTKVKEVKKEIKEDKKRSKNKEREKENINFEKENRKKDDGRCVSMTRSGGRCKNQAISGGYCSIHEKVEQNKSGVKKQCKGRRTDGQRCKMQTANKSGYCYYHD